MRRTLGQARQGSDQLPVVKALRVPPSIAVEDVLSRLFDDQHSVRQGVPALVMSAEGEHLLGILSAYDLL